MELRGITHLYPSPMGMPRGVSSVSLSLREGCIYGVLGPNGAGKTTLFNILSGLIIAQEGDLYLRGTRITRLALWRRARLGLGYLSQTGSLAQQLSVKMNLILGYEAGQKWGMPRTSLTDERHEIEQALSLMGITDRAHLKVDRLSGGERRRCELAKLLLQRPHVLLLDEPFAALDTHGIEQTITLIRCAKAWGAMILLTDHQKIFVEEVCEQVIVLNNGSVVEVRPPSISRRDPERSSWACD